MCDVGKIVPDPVEAYLASLNRQSDPVLDAIARAGARQNLPLVDAEVGALLRVLATAVGAARILEIGTAIGYSSIWLAGALPAHGMLFTMEMNPDRAQEARANIERAGLADRVVVMIGDAQRLVAKVAGPFDLIFQDGDKRLYSPLLDRLVALLRPGGLLITDNVLWDGEVVPGYTSSPARNADDARAIADYNERLNTHPLLTTATVPLRDGVAISVKRIGP
jgi:predicted O-methyltransferase YrrM